MGGLYVDFGMINSDNVEQISVSVVIALVLPLEIRSSFHCNVRLRKGYSTKWDNRG
jgi:hypothetical protein